MRLPTFCVVALQHLGYESGQVDGLPGPRLAHAIRVLKADHGLPVTGRADTALNDLLHDMVAASPSRTFIATTAPPPRRGF